MGAGAFQVQLPDGRVVFTPQLSCWSREGSLRGQAQHVALHLAACSPIPSLQPTSQGSAWSGPATLSPFFQVQGSGCCRAHPLALQATEEAGIPSVALAFSLSQRALEALRA